MKNIIVTLTCLLTSCWLITSCAVDDSIKDHPSVLLENELASEAFLSEIPPLEKLYGAKLNDEHLEFSVVSFGCSKAKDFELDYIKSNNKVTGITVVRLKRDLCRRKPELKHFRLKIKKLSRQNISFKINNPFSVFSLTRQ